MKVVTLPTQDALAPSEAQTATGTAQTPAVSAERAVSREVRNAAHDEMLRAVARGECVIFVDALVSPGIRVQHSAWLIAGSGALFATWHFAQGQWTETRSYLVATKDMAALAELLSRAVGSRS